MSGVIGTIGAMAAAARPDKARDPGSMGDVVSHSGVSLTRATTFKFTLDVNREEQQRLLAHAGAYRLAFNHHIGRVKANLDQRAAERSYGVLETDLTPSLSWSRVSFINEMNAWKDGRAPDAPTNPDGSRGLRWRSEVSADVFETASVHAAQALNNWADSRIGKRSGKVVGFPRFKSRHKTTPAFRLRAKYAEGRTPPVRPTGPKAIRFPKFGQLRVRESTRRLRRMYESGRFHAYAASFRFEHGRWIVAITGMAAPFHHIRRSPVGRYQARVGIDLGLKTLAVVADGDAQLLHRWEGVKALKSAEARLRRANKAYSRTKSGSAGRARAARRLGSIHARIAALRRSLLHEITTTLACRYGSVAIEDLNTTGMLANRKLARAVADASFGELRRQLEYKTYWFGTELIVADRWFPSSKTCSGCGQVKTDLTLSERSYECGTCGLVLDRDVNAAINLARYTPRPAKTKQLQRGAA